VRSEPPHETRAIGNDRWCAADGEDWPCAFYRTILAIEREAATLDVERLARAMKVVYEQDLFLNRQSDDFAPDAEYIAREYRDGGAK